MAVRDPNRTTDGFTNLSAGIDSGRDPSTVAQNQCAFGVNATFRGGFATCRPGFWKRILSFPNSSGAEDSTLRTRFETGRFQGATCYRPRDNDPYLVAAIGGRLFKIETRLYKVQEITPTAGAGPTNREQVWFEQAEDFLVVQDGLSKAIIFDGAMARQADAEQQEIPVGTMMAYGWGRLWVASPSGLSFVGGDLAYSSSGTAKYNLRDSVLKFTENEFLNGGGEFTVPANAGPITAMRFTANLDTSTGQGPLQVFTDSHGFSVNAPVDREQWQNLDYPIQTVNLINYGPKGHRGVATVNSDLWYRAEDGIRSFAVAQRGFESRWVNTPMSKEMNRVILSDDPNLLGFASCVVFDNRLLTTISPARASLGVYFRGLASLDFDPVSSMRFQEAPSWEGVWTGLRFLQIVPCGNRCFAFGLASNDTIDLWEITRSERFDHQSDTNDNKIPWSFESRRMGFKDQAQELKELTYSDIWLDRIYSLVEIDVDYRPDSYPAWLDWWNGSLCATYRQCAATAECTLLNNYNEQYRSRLKLPQVPETCDELTNKRNRLGYEFQVKFNFVGFCRVTMARLHAYQQEEDPTGVCLDAQLCSGTNLCDTNPFTYLIH